MEIMHACLTKFVILFFFFHGAIVLIVIMIGASLLGFISCGISVM